VAKNHDLILDESGVLAVISGNPSIINELVGTRGGGGEGQTVCVSSSLASIAVPFPNGTFSTRSRAGDI